MEKTIMVNRYKSDKFGVEGAEVIEMNLDGKKMNEAIMHFVIKPGGRASVSLAMGTQVGMAYLVSDFLKSYDVTTLVNQVSNQSEMKAMYRAGLRLPHKLNLKKSLEMLDDKQSLLMSI